MALPIAAAYSYANFICISAIAWREHIAYMKLSTTYIQISLFCDFLFGT